MVGLVGESGCGKSTLGRMVAGILPPTEGERFWRADLAELAARPRPRRRLAVQMIFQDPYASLNPRMRVVDIVGEAPVVHGLVEAGERDDYVDRAAAARRARPDARCGATRTSSPAASAAASASRARSR